MEWNEKLQMIIDYVEHHLQRVQEPIDPGEISKIAECSFGFFQKVFSYMNGISFAQYVRSRKLTLAGYDLKSTDQRVVDVSYLYGYDSPTSFTRAFQQFHGVSPKEARISKTKLKVVPKMQVSVKQEYTWRVEQKPALRLIGKSIRFFCDDEEKSSKILEFWSECQRNGVFSCLISMDKGEPSGLFGLFHNVEESRNEMQYSIMAATDGEVPEGYGEFLIPETSWAVFDLSGPVPQAIHSGWKYLEEEWLVKYPFRHAKCPELEWYSSGNFYDKNYLSQIWIPILDGEQ